MDFQIKSFKSLPYVGVSENRGTPKSSILIGFSIINHPFWGTPILGNTHAFFSPTNFLSDVRKKKKGTNLKHFLHPMAPQDRKLHLSGKEANLVESFIQKCPKNICFSHEQIVGGLVLKLTGHKNCYYK